MNVVTFSPEIPPINSSRQYWPLRFLSTEQQVTVWQQPHRIGLPFLQASLFLLLEERQGYLGLGWEQGLGLENALAL